MRTYNSPYISDWFVVSLRWLAIVGLMFSLASGDQMYNLHNLLLGGLIAWNLALTFIAGLNKRLQNHRMISLIIDVSVVTLFFWLQGGLNSPTF